MTHFLLSILHQFQGSEISSISEIPHKADLCLPTSHTPNLLIHKRNKCTERSNCTWGKLASNFNDIPSMTNSYFSQSSEVECTEPHCHVFFFDNPTSMLHRYIRFHNLITRIFEIRFSLTEWYFSQPSSSAKDPGISRNSSNSFILLPEVSH